MPYRYDVSPSRMRTPIRAGFQRFHSGSGTLPSSTSREYCPHRKNLGEDRSQYADGILIQYVPPENFLEGSGSKYVCDLLNDDACLFNVLAECWVLEELKNKK